MHIGIVAAIVTIGVFSIVTGFSYPFLSLVLERNGYQPGLIGLSAAMTPLGMVVSAPFILSMARTAGACRLCIFALLGIAVLSVCLSLTSSFGAWLALRLFLGIAMNIVFVLSEAWINELATPGNRGRLIGLYATVGALGFATGPAILSLVGSAGWLPFAIVAVTSAAVIPFIVMARDDLPEFQVNNSKGALSFCTLAPVLLLCVGFAALFDQTVMSMLPVHLKSLGWSETASTQALAVLIAGNILFQVPIGWLADKLPRRHLLFGFALFVAAGSVALNAAAANLILLYLLLLLWGAAAFGMYTVALAELGHGFSGSQVLAGSCAFAFMWGVGGASGPIFAGAAMTGLGTSGLPASVGLIAAAVCLVLCIMPLVRSRQPRSQTDTNTSLPL